MKHDFTRRDFLAASAAFGASAVAVGRLGTDRRLVAAPFKTTLQKALIGAADEATLQSWKDAGFAGMEASKWDATPSEAADGRKIAEKLGMRIHSVMRGWANFNSPDPGKVAEDIQSVETALKAAQGYGADAVLLVPCRVGGMPMPEAWEFDIEFDEKTGHLTQVVAGSAIDATFDNFVCVDVLARDVSESGTTNSYVLLMACNHAFHGGPAIT